MTAVDVTPPPAAPAATVEKAAVLVVDDAMMDRCLAGKIVERDPNLRAVFASDGAEALQVLATLRPAAVLTDLQMPGMDGLELVRAVREQYPTVPVILMTGSGSEEIAIEALRSGAASYVPKRQLARDLEPTLERVISLAKGETNQKRLHESVTHLETRFALENDPALVPALVASLQEHVTRLGVCDETQRIRVAIALEEAVLNGLYHGNLELSSDLRQDGGNAFERLGRERRDVAPYASRRLHVTARVSRSEAVFVVRDEGPGYDPGQLPDPTDPANLTRVGGRGLLLIRTFMDAVALNATGNEITLTKLGGSAR